MTISSLTGNFTFGFLMGHSCTHLDLLSCCISIASSSILTFCCIHNASFSISFLISVSSSSIYSLVIISWFFLLAYLRPSVAMLLSLSALLENLLLTPANLSASESSYNIVDCLLDCCLLPNNHHRFSVLCFLPLPSPSA
jgi:hypothetical protein